MIEPTGQPARIKKATSKITTIYNRCLPALQKYALLTAKHAPQIARWIELIGRIHEWTS